jgi:hypothetical protein
VRLVVEEADAFRDMILNVLSPAAPLSPAR